MKKIIFLIMFLVVGLIFSDDVNDDLLNYNYDYDLFQKEYKWNNINIELLKDNIFEITIPNSYSIDYYNVLVQKYKKDYAINNNYKKVPSKKVRPDEIDINNYSPKDILFFEDDDIYLYVASKISYLYTVTNDFKDIFKDLENEERKNYYNKMFIEVLDFEIKTEKDFIYIGGNFNFNGMANYKKSFEKPEDKKGFGVFYYNKKRDNQDRKYFTFHTKFRFKVYKLDDPEYDIKDRKKYREFEDSNPKLIPLFAFPNICPKSDKCSIFFEKYKYTDEEIDKILQK